MRDPISVPRVNALSPYVRDKFKAFIETAENKLMITLRVVQGLRTWPEQHEIWKAGHNGDKRPKVTNADAGQSYHNYGLAVDLGQVVAGDINWKFNYRLLQPIAQDFGLVWGADWDNDGKTAADGDKDEHMVDMPHYQITFGYKWQTLQIIYKSGTAFLPGTKYLRLPMAEKYTGIKL
jgi:hypothetical protein